MLVEDVEDVAADVLQLFFDLKQHVPGEDKSNSCPFLLQCLDRQCMWETREPLRGRLSTVDLLVLTSLDKLVLILQKLCTFYKTG